MLRNIPPPKLTNLLKLTNLPKLPNLPNLSNLPNLPTPTKKNPRTDNHSGI